MNKYPVLFGWKVALCESWGLSNYLKYFLQFKYWHLGWYLWRNFLGRKDQVVLEHPYSGVECWEFLQAVPCSLSPVLSPKIQKCLHNWELLCDLLIALLGVQLHVSQVGHLPSLHHWQLFCLRQMACERSTRILGHCYFFQTILWEQTWWGDVSKWVLRTLLNFFESVAIARFTVISDF